MGTHSLVLDGADWREGCRSELTGSCAVDVAGLLASMEGYRFILDQRASTPTHLVWSDAVEDGEWQSHWLVLQRHLAGASLLNLKQQLHLPLLADNISSAAKDTWVRRFEALGARVAVAKRGLRTSANRTPP